MKESSERSKTIDDERMVPLDLAAKLYGKVKPGYKLCFYRHVAAYDYVAGLLEPRHRVLDVGSGTGYGSSILAGRCAHLTGVDYSHEAVEYATKNYGCEKCVFRVGDALHTGLPDACVDVVCAVQVLEHMADQKGFILEVLRVLAPGGRFAAVTPNKVTFSPDSEVGFSFHYKEYRARELVEFLSGFFAQVRLYGLFATSLVSRVHHDKKLSRMGRGRLLGLMPVFIRKKVRKFIWHMRKDSEITAKDFEVTDSLPVEDSLDLVAVCQSGVSRG